MKKYSTLLLVVAILLSGCNGSTKEAGIYKVKKGMFSLTCMNKGILLEIFQKTKGNNGGRELMGLMELGYCREVRAPLFDVMKVETYENHKFAVIKLPDEDNGDDKRYILFNSIEKAD